MKPRVLLVDDEADFRELLEYNLARQDFEVFTAANGMEALNQARQLLPDVILLDLMLPDLDGFSVCELLHVQSSTGMIPVIIISALGGHSINARIIELGAICYLRKPVDFRALGDCIRSAFQQQQEDMMARMADDSCTCEGNPGNG